MTRYRVEKSKKYRIRKCKKEVAVYYYRDIIEKYRDRFKKSKQLNNN